MPSDQIPAAGQPFRPSASQWAEHNAAARAVRAMQRESGTDRAGFGWEATRVHLTNSSGTDLERGYILGLTGTVFPAVADDERAFLLGPAFSGVTPTDASRYAVLMEPLADGATKHNVAVVSGIVAAKVVVTDENHVRALWKDNGNPAHDHLLKSDNAGVDILWRESGTGVVWALIRLSNLPDGMRRAKLLAPLYSCSEAQADLLLDDEAAESSEVAGLCGCEVERTITVGDVIGAVDNCLLAEADESGALFLPADSRILIWHRRTVPESFWFVQVGGLCDPSSSSSDPSSSSSEPSSSSSDLSSSSDECIACFNDVCVEDLPVATSMTEGVDQFLIVKDGCLYRIAANDCETSSSSS